MRTMPSWTDDANKQMLHQSRLCSILPVELSRLLTGIHPSESIQHSAQRLLQEEQNRTYSFHGGDECHNASPSHKVEVIARPTPIPMAAMLLPRSCTATIGTAADSLLRLRRLQLRIPKGRTRGARPEQGSDRVPGRHGPAPEAHGQKLQNAARR